MGLAAAAASPPAAAPRTWPGWPPLLLCGRAPGSPDEARGPRCSESLGLSSSGLGASWQTSREGPGWGDRSPAAPPPGNSARHPARCPVCPPSSPAAQETHRGACHWARTIRVAPGSGHLTGWGRPCVTQAQPARCNRSSAQGEGKRPPVSRGLGNSAGGILSPGGKRRPGNRARRDLVSVTLGEHLDQDVPEVCAAPAVLADLAKMCSFIISGWGVCHS